MEEYIITRTKICKSCPIHDVENNMCNAYLYLNPINNDVSDTPKDGYIKGCGCFLEHKIPNMKAKCPCGKWKAIR